MPTPEELARLQHARQEFDRLTKLCGEILSGTAQQAHQAVVDAAAAKAPVEGKKVDGA